MLRVVGSITRDHDLWLVALGCLLCIATANTSLRLLNPAAEGEPWQRTVRAGTSILALGTGIWTAHFVSMLAFHPTLPVSFDVPLCMLSLVLCITATAIAVRLRPRQPDATASIFASGLILAGGIGAMHVIGLHSLLLPRVVHYDAHLVIACLILGAVCALAAMALLARQAAGWASVLLTLAVALPHFVASASVTLQPIGSAAIAPVGIPRPVLVIAAAAAALLIFGLTSAVSLLDRHVTRRLAEQARRFRSLADSTFEGLIFERGGEIVDANRAICQLTGTDAASLIGRALSDLIPAIQWPQTEHPAPAEHVLRLSGGRVVPVEVLWQGDPARGERVVAVRDLSREKAAEGQIERLAQFDPLTGLANRALFDRHLHRAIAFADRSKTGLALLYVDLDRFESVTESLDPSAVEQILVQTARRLSATVRETDTVARVGRDEFVIVQTLIDQASDAAALADRIVTEVALPFALDDDDVVCLSTSVGIALYPENGTQPRELIKSALIAVRQAKNDGRGRWRYFEPAMDVLLRTKRSLEHDLRLALRDRQFSLNYQPFVDTATLEVIGYEALLRWHHAERGPVAPGDFIPLAEKSGLIVPIGNWVLATACAEAASWGQPLIISVNLSPAQFLQPGIVATVADALQRTGLPPGRLELEITEGTLMHDTHNALGILTELKALGVRIAMDDFGTGYSSLSYLRKFPFDKIKIDRSFMSDLEHDPEAGTIVQAIIAMSRSLRLDVTAEGVETRQQLALLRALGCNFVQGYLLGRPHSAGQLDLRTAKPRWHVIDHTGARLVATPTARSA